MSSAIIIYSFVNMDSSKVSNTSQQQRFKSKGRWSLLWAKRVKTFRQQNIHRNNFPAQWLEHKTLTKERKGNTFRLLTSLSVIHSQALLWLTSVSLPSGNFLYYFIRPYVHWFPSYDLPFTALGPTLSIGIITCNCNDIENNYIYFLVIINYIYYVNIIL